MRKSLKKMRKRIIIVVIIAIGIVISGYIAYNANIQGNNAIFNNVSPSVNNANLVNVANEAFKRHFQEIISNNNTGSEKCKATFDVYKTEILWKNQADFIAKIYYESDVETQYSNAEESGEGQTNAEQSGVVTTDRVITATTITMKIHKNNLGPGYTMVQSGPNISHEGMEKVNIIKKYAFENDPNFVTVPFLFKYDEATDQLFLTNNEGETWIPVPILLQKMVNNYQLGSTVSNLQQLSNTAVIANKDGIGIAYSKGDNINIAYDNFKNQGINSWVTSVIPAQEDNAQIIFNINNNGQGYVIGTSSVAMGVSSTTAYLTSDFGKTWTKVNVPNGRQYGVVTAGAFTGKYGVIGYSSCSNQGINLYRTTDGGQTWKHIIASDGEYYSVTSINLEEDGKGTMIASNSNDVPMEYTTSDFGKTWRVKSING